jgi:hypothetical protein
MTEATRLLTALASLRPLARLQADRAEEGALVGLATHSFEAIVLEALLTRTRAVAGESEGLPAEAVQGLDPATASSPQPAAGPHTGESQPVPSPEGAVIEREAERTGVDPRLLTALRRAENGGPGREFGVRSVDAPSLHAQGRVAANTIRNTALRYARQGGEVLDAATGRYSEGFLRFLSARYAPVGAANDPTGLNRHHAGNLIALYRQAHERGGPG